jgi:hypothetical protein
LYFEDRPGIDRVLERFTNPLKPFATTLDKYLNEIDEKERSMKELASMATMAGVKGLHTLCYGITEDCMLSVTVIVDLRGTMGMVSEMRELFIQISNEMALQWLNAVDPDPMYDFNRDRRLEGTCEWVFRNESYKAWTCHEGSRDLWIVGIPGK